MTYIETLYLNQFFSLYNFNEIYILFYMKDYYDNEYYVYDQFSMISRHYILIKNTKIVNKTYEQKNIYGIQFTIFKLK